MAKDAESENATGPVEIDTVYRVFISYASQDNAVADSVCQALEQAGVTCWIAPRDVVPGETYPAAIVKAIDGTKLVVLILSKHGAASQHVLREVERACSKRHPIVAFRIDATQMPPDFQYFLNTSQWLDASVMGVKEGLPRLVDAVQHVITSASHVALGNERPAPVFYRASVSKLALGRTAALLLVLATAVTSGYFALDKLWFGKHKESGQRSSATSVINEKTIAVLPFVDMSERKDQEYFADGLAEEVLSLLSTLPDLKVISRTSSFQFKGQTADLRTIGTQLGAAYVVEGSVRRYGDRILVTAELINSSDGVNRWSNTYEQNLGDVLRMQQDIAAALGRALQIEVRNATWGTVTPLVNTEAYNLYLHGLHSMDRNDKPGLDEGISYFERALALDPTLIRAREKLAHAHYLEYDTGLVGPTEGAGRLRGDLALLLRDNPTSAIGHALRAELLITYDWDWAGAQREADLALSLARNSSLALYAAADLAGVLGRRDQSETLFRQALALDPLDADTYNEFSWMLYHAGRYAEAEAELRRLLEIRPSYAALHFDLGLYLLAEGKLPEALMRKMNLD